jgi:DNA-binding beta-propeller fold protein YncE
MKPIFEFGGFNWNEEETSFNYISTSTRGGFNVPIDITCTIKDIFITDRDNNRVQKFDMDGNFLLSFGGQGSEMGRISYPLGIDCDLMGNVYVADSRNDRIQKFDINGNFILEMGGFGYTDGKLNRPVDVTIDTDGKIYVIDSGNRRIEIFERYGHYVGEIKLEKKGRFDSIDLIRDEVILITNNKSGELLFYSKSGEILEVIGKLSNPTGVTVDESGNIYVVESGESQITKFSLRKNEEKWKFEQ